MDLTKKSLVLYSNNNKLYYRESSKEKGAICVPSPTGGKEIAYGMALMIECISDTEISYNLVNAPTSGLSLISNLNGFCGARVWEIDNNGPFMILGETNARDGDPVLWGTSIGVKVETDSIVYFSAHNEEGTSVYEFKGKIELGSGPGLSAWVKPCLG